MSVHPPDRPEENRAPERRWRLEVRTYRALRSRLRRQSAATGRPDAPIEAEIQWLPPLRTRRREVYLDTDERHLGRADLVLRVRPRGNRFEASLLPLHRTDLFASIPSQRVAGSDLAALWTNKGRVGERLRRLKVGPEAFAPRIALRVATELYPVVREGRRAGTLALESVTLEGVGDRPPTRYTATLHTTGSDVAPPPAAASLASALLGPLESDPGCVAEEPSRPRWAEWEHRLGPGRDLRLRPSVVAPEMSAAEAAYAVLRRHFASFHRHEPGTRIGDDPEHLHDMRVASRRMRAALRVFRDAVPPAEAETLNGELRSCAQSLGAVRDLDVQIELLRGWSASFVTVSPSAAEPIFERLRSRREGRRAELLELLDGRGFQLLRTSLLRRLRRGPVPPAPGAELPPEANEPVTSAAARWIRRSRRRVLKAGDRIREESPPAAYHEVRIRAKRFRYALEFTEPLYGAPSRRLIESLVELQDLLGEHQDLQVALELLQDVCGEKPPLPAETLRAAGELGQILAARAALLRREFPKTYRRLRGGRWDKWKKADRARRIETAGKAFDAAAEPPGASVTRIDPISIAPDRAGSPPTPDGKTREDPRWN